MNLLCSKNERAKPVCAGSLWMWLLLVVSLLAAPVSAAPPSVQVSHAWARATVPGQKVAGVYLEIRSARDARVVAVKSKAAASAEMHSMSNDAGVMKMRKLDALMLPAGQSVQLKPGGDHIMLLDIKQQLKSGDRVLITLIVEEGGKTSSVKVDAEVRELQ